MSPWRQHESAHPGLQNEALLSQAPVLAPGMNINTIDNDSVGVSNFQSLLPKSPIGIEDQTENTYSQMDQNAFVSGIDENMLKSDPFML